MCLCVFRNPYFWMKGKFGATSTQSKFTRTHNTAHMAHNMSMIPLSLACCLERPSRNSRGTTDAVKVVGWRVHGAGGMGGVGWRVVHMAVPHLCGCKKSAVHSRRHTFLPCWTNVWCFVLSSSKNAQKLSHSTVSVESDQNAKKMISDANLELFVWV